MKYRLIALIAVIFTITFPAVPSHASVNVDCLSCHQGGTVNAADTISPDDETCFLCHNPKYPPQWQGLNVHDIHAYNIIVIPMEDYIERHPQTELECSSCHQHEYECTDCHRAGIPHIDGSTNCNSCHNTMVDLFQHRTINLTKHNIFGIEAPGSCEICHKKGGGLLKLTSGKTVEIAESQELCRQCHSTAYKQWKNGEHWTVSAETGGSEDTCSYCHDVHAPELLYWVPPPSHEDFSFLKIGILSVFAVVIALIAFYIRRLR